MHGTWIPYIPYVDTIPYPTLDTSREVKARLIKQGELHTLKYVTDGVRITYKHWI